MFAAILSEMCHLTDFLEMPAVVPSIHLFPYIPLSEFSAIPTQPAHHDTTVLGVVDRKSGIAAIMNLVSIDRRFAQRKRRLKIVHTEGFENVLAFLICASIQETPGGR